MVLEGTVTNVAAFGAFVDVGVHQDGLVHVSALANRFVSDPREVVKSGQVVRVKVLEADPERKRISLTLRLDDEPGAPGGRAASTERAAGGRGDRAAGDRAGGGRGDSRADRPRQSAPQASSKQPAGKPASERQTSDRRTPARQPQKSTPTPSPVNTAMAEALRQAGLAK